MGVIIIYDPGGAFPITVPVPVIEIKERWNDPWTYLPDLQFVSGSHVAAGEGYGRMVVKRRYGLVKQPYETGFALRPPIILDHYWIRMGFVAGGRVSWNWVGLVPAETRDILDTGDPSDPTRPPTGMQTWSCYSPMHILNKIHVHESIWQQTINEEAVERRIGWVPDLNSRDDRRILLGNRTAEKVDGTYLYGGADIWSHHEHIEYLLKRFVEQPDGPKWRIGGAVDALKDLKEQVPFGSTQTVAQMLGELIPNRLGLDYVIRPFELLTQDDVGEDVTHSGFELYVFALTASTFSFNDFEMPRNPNTVQVAAPLSRQFESVKVTASFDHSYSKIRVIGNRIVVVGTLNALNHEIVPRWSDELETEYKQGVPGVGAQDPNAAQLHDAWRRDARFRTVYQQYAMPARDSDTLEYRGTFPSVDLIGEHDPDAVADYQYQVRQTLTWTPLREGFDYSQDPPVDNTAPGSEPDLLPPAVWLWDSVAKQYMSCEELGIDVSVSETELGVFLQTTPNHLLAKFHWTVGAEPTEVRPLYDYEDMHATLAFHTDQRLVLGFDVAGNDDGTELVIEMPDAECWIMAKHTTLGGTVTSPPGSFGTVTSGETARVLRNDADRMAIVMAGAMSRYVNSRNRAALGVHSFLPWGDLVGRVMTVIETTGGLTNVWSPITAMEWGVDDKEPLQPKTMMRTGYAQ